MAAAFDLELMERARDAVNADKAFTRLGTCDVRVGLTDGAQAFLVDFVAFECAGVQAIDVEALRDAEIIIELDAATWQRYLQDRCDGSGATLISLDVDAPGRIVRGADPLQTLKFERYHLSLQAFVDTMARLAAPQRAARHAAV